MLVLGRQRSETIAITLEDGRRITVMIVEIRGDNVRIGIDAPRTVTVNRSEIDDAMAAEQRMIDSKLEPGIGEDYA